MKMLFVSNLFGSTARGGAERIAAREAAALAAAGHDVHVVSAGRRASVDQEDGLPVTRIVAPNIAFYADLHRLGMAMRFFWHLRDMANGGSARRFAAVLRAEHPDVVHTHNLMGLGFLLPAVIRREQRRRRVAGESPLRHVHTVHDVQLLHPSGLLPNATPGGTPVVRGIAQRVYVALMRRLMGSPDAVVFPSAYLRNLHDQYGFFHRSDRRVVMNPVPDPRLASRAAPHLPAFLFVGQVERHKGIVELIEAWKAAKLYGAYGATLEVAGDGTLADALRAKAPELQGVSVLGPLDAEALARAYGRASFVVVPSTVIENQPTVILEALSSGTPVIATRSGGVPELVTEGATGFLVPPVDTAALADALRHGAGLASEGAQWEAMSAACIRWADGRNMAAHMSALMGIYGAVQ